MPEPNRPLDPSDSLVEPVSRRSFLKSAGMVGLGASAASVIAACGGTPASSHASNANLATPKRGGNLRIGIIGNGTSETFNPALVASNIDVLHAYCVFDPFVRVAPHHGRSPGLIVKWDHNRDASVYELTLRSGVTWHDGKPFTADDVVYTFQTLGSPSNLGHGSSIVLDLPNIKKLGTHLVRVPLKIPVADLAAYFINLNAAFVVQNGSKRYDHPIGTGPYKFVSFTPGQRAVLTANRDYWDSPRPYPDRLEVLSISDDTARVNALLAGDIDIAGELPYPTARANLSGQSGYNVVVGTPGNSIMFYMRVDKAPFNDNRVREAMKLLIGRQQLIETALSGFGAVGNDIVGYGLPYFDGSLPQRPHDIARAKSLLKAAGQSDLRVTLDTADSNAGFVQAATAFSQQATAAGVTIQVKQLPAADYYSTALGYLTHPLAQDIWSAGSLNAYYSDALLSKSPINETHWDYPSFDQLYYKAQGAVDSAQAVSLWKQVQSIQYNQGGNIVWAYTKSTDGISKKVRGFGGPGTGWLYGTDDLRVWNWGLA